MLDLYKNIKNRRIELGLTQEDLAKKLGYSGKSMIAHIESGNVDLAQSKIVAFAKALEVTPAQLMGWEDSDETADILEKAFSDDPERRALFSLSKKASSEQVKLAYTFLKTLIGDEEGGSDNNTDR